MSSKCKECRHAYTSARCNACIHYPQKIVTDLFEAKEEPIPFIAVGGHELGEEVKGDTIRCPHCDSYHELKYGKNEAGEESKLLQFYTCDESDNTYLYAIAGKRLKVK